MLHLFGSRLGWMFLLLLSSASVHAQLSKCENRPKIFMMPPNLAGYDTAMTEEMARQLRNYVKSEQQRMNYLLVPDEASADLRLVFILRLETGKDGVQATRFISAFEQLGAQPGEVGAATDECTVLRFPKFGKHPEGKTKAPGGQEWMHPSDLGLLLWLQENDVLSEMFRTHLGKKAAKEYRDRVDPRKIVLLRAFESEDAKLLAHAPCLEYWLLQKMKECLASSETLDFNAGLAVAPPPLPEGVPVIYIRTELVPYGEHQFKLVSRREDDGEKLASITMSRTMLEKGLYRPFISYWMYEVAWRVANP